MGETPSREDSTSHLGVREVLSFHDVDNGSDVRIQIAMQLKTLHGGTRSSGPRIQWSPCLTSQERGAETLTEICLMGSTCWHTCKGALMFFVALLKDMHRVLWSGTSFRSRSGNNPESPALGSLVCVLGLPWLSTNLCPHVSGSAILYFESCVTPQHTQFPTELKYPNPKSFHCPLEENTRFHAMLDLAQVEDSNGSVGLEGNIGTRGSGWVCRGHCGHSGQGSWTLVRRTPAF